AVAPALEGAPRGGHRAIHVGLAGEGDDRHRLFGCRVDDGEIVGLGGRGVRTVDVKMSQVLHGCLVRGRICQRRARPSAWMRFPGTCSNNIGAGRGGVKTLPVYPTAAPARFFQGLMFVKRAWIARSAPVAQASPNSAPVRRGSLARRIG